MSMYYSPEVNGFFDAAVNTFIPEDAIPISNDEHAALLADQAAGLRIVAGADGVPISVPYEIPYSVLVGAAKWRIDAAAERARLRYITPGAGQALVYQRKEAQARACLAAHDAINQPNVGAYPALDAEVGITGVDTLTVAQIVVSLADAWGAVADQIETLRLQAKAAIDGVPYDAPDIEAQIAAIEAGIVWPAA